MTVLGENEKQDLTRYVVRKGEDGMKPTNFTLFRQSERFYKHTEDFSGAIDFKNLNENIFKKIQKIDSKTGVGCYHIEDIPGLYILPNYLSLNEQNKILDTVFVDELCPKNINSLTAVYEMPEDTFYDCMKKYGKEYELTLNRKDKEESVSLTIENWIRKIRWINLGLNYNWQSLSYDFESKIIDFSYIQELSKRASSEIGLEIKPEAGIINYYQLKDSLTAHVDRSEKNMSVPLISFSVGNSCVYLIGGKTREEPVTAIILNSGDALIMSEKCRKNYHGVPKILEYCTEDLKESQFCEQIKNSRININVRQVF